MISVASSPLSPDALEKDFRQQSPERAILRLMFESPYEFKYASADALKFEIELRAATVGAAIMLNESGMGFSTFRRSRCNKDF